MIQTAAMIYLVAGPTKKCFGSTLKVKIDAQSRQRLKFAIQDKTNSHVEQSQIQNKQNDKLRSNCELSQMEYKNFLITVSDTDCYFAFSSGELGRDSGKGQKVFSVTPIDLTDILPVDMLRESRANTDIVAIFPSEFS